jgi:hypothetical protein
MNFTVLYDYLFLICYKSMRCDTVAIAPILTRDRKNGARTGAI